MSKKYLTRARGTRRALAAAYPGQCAPLGSPGAGWQCCQCQAWNKSSEPACLECEHARCAEGSKLIRCAGCGEANAIPGTPFCFTCDPSYPRDLPTSTGPGSARVRRDETPIPEFVCVKCGRTDCAAQQFIDSKPEWVGDNPSYYADELEPECTKAAEDIGVRYADLWLLAAKMVRAGELYMGEYAACDNLAAFMREQTEKQRSRR